MGLTDGHNIYAYVHSNPLTGYDPYGLRSQGNGARASGSKSNLRGGECPVEECTKVCFSTLNPAMASYAIGTGTTEATASIVQRGAGARAAQVAGGLRAANAVAGAWADSTGVSCFVICGLDLPYHDGFK